jgi:hypothetical protein
VVIIAGTGIGYTAMLTAFYVDNAPRLPLRDRLPVLAFWLLPGAIATPLIVRAVIGARHAAPQARLDAGSGFPGMTVS